jgi:hypothetical protein
MIQRVLVTSISAVVPRTLQRNQDRWDHRLAGVPTGRAELISARFEFSGYFQIAEGKIYCSRWWDPTIFSLTSFFFGVWRAYAGLFVYLFSSFFSYAHLSSKCNITYCCILLLFPFCQFILKPPCSADHDRSLSCASLYITRLEAWTMS